MKLVMRFFFSVLLFAFFLSGLGLNAQSDKPTATDSVKVDPLKKFYRPVGISFGVFYNRLSGVGARRRYIEATDSYDATRLDGKSLFGFSIGMHVWRQRTHFQLELGWSKGDFLEEGGFRSTSNGGSVDTYVSIGYFAGGFRIKQALITRRILATGGIFIVEEGRKRHAKTKSNGRLVESRSFPADEFYLWSLGLDIQLAPGLYLGYSYSWTYNQDDFDPIYGHIDNAPIVVEGFTMSSFQLSFVY